MKNGEYPPDRETAARLRKLQKLVIELAQSIDLVEQAVMMLFASVIDLSNRTGAQKDKLNRKVLNAVLRLHRTSWRKRRKQLSKYLG
jgi:hypothetical protein